VALLLPKEHKVEHTNAVGELSDEQLEAMVEELGARIAARAENAKIIEGSAVYTTPVKTPPSDRPKAPSLAELEEQLAARTESEPQGGRSRGQAR